MILKGIRRGYKAEAKWLIFSFMLLFFSLSNLLAEIPVKFIYQGNLREKGILVSGIRQMQFKVYDSTSSSTPLWVGPVVDVSISTGVFRVVVEPSLSRGDLNKVLYLELTVNSQTLSPREQILPSVYAINTLYHEGKRYHTSSSTPSDANAGDLWFNTNENILYYYTGAQWIGVSVSSSPSPHHLSHEPGGDDLITRLSTITFEGSIIVSSNSYITTTGGILNVSTNTTITGYISVSSYVYASGFSGDGFLITNINGANIRDSTMPPSKLTPCSNGQTLIYNGSSWVCGSISLVAETDPWSIHNYFITSSSQTASFWVSSGTVESFYVLNNLDVYQTARFNPSSNGLFITSSGNVGIGDPNPLNKLSIKGDVNIDSGGKDALTITPSANVGIGVDNPSSKFEVVGEDQPGMITVYKAGDKRIGFFRRK
ncbi:MAG: hypothetical protein ACP5IO_05455 [Elusimicrobiales bacterium]